MKWIDTHTHLYDTQFESDIEQVIHAAIDKGVTKMLLPNCDYDTLAPMLALHERHPLNCYPMIGLHPTYVQSNYKEELAKIESYITHEANIAIGEIGLDFYWDTTYTAEQYAAFETQIDWALSLDLPIVIHTRSSIDEAIAVITRKQNGQLRGVFHCFGGDALQAQKVIDLGFHIGIGGVLTFKNSNLKEIVKDIPLEKIILETDAPYLAPVPYRGKRNESSYIPLIGEALAIAMQQSIATIAATTTDNAIKLFRLD